MKILIIGRGKGVWDEVKEAQEMCCFDAVMAINGAGCDYPDYLHHWVTFHIEKMQGWIKKRRTKGYPEAGTLWCSSYYHKVIPCLPMKRVHCNGGSSGRIGVEVAAKHLDATHIVLCGMPLLAEFGHYDEKGAWTEADMHRAQWDKIPEDVKVRLRSMSGWTKEQYGAPTRIWLS